MQRIGVLGGAGARGTASFEADGARLLCCGILCPQTILVPPYTRAPVPPKSLRHLRIVDRREHQQGELRLAVSANSEICVCHWFIFTNFSRYIDAIHKSHNHKITKSQITKGFCDNHQKILYNLLIYYIYYNIYNILLFIIVILLLPFLFFLFYFSILFFLL